MKSSKEFLQEAQEKFLNSKAHSERAMDINFDPLRLWIVKLSNSGRREDIAKFNVLAEFLFSDEEWMAFTFQNRLDGYIGVGLRDREFRTKYFLKVAQNIYQKISSGEIKNIAPNSIFPLIVETIKILLPANCPNVSIEQVKQEITAEFKSNKS